MIAVRKNGDITRKVAALGDLTRDELAERWAGIYGCPPPPGVRRELLQHAAAWHLQAKHHGGLSPATRKSLKKAMQRVAGELARGSPSDIHEDNPPRPIIARESASEPGTVQFANAASGSVDRRILSAGARLLRDWNGRTHVVDVTELGFLFEGRTYRSLSAIARQITGAQWSGPRFFGL